MRDIENTSEFSLFGLGLDWIRIKSITFAEVHHHLNMVRLDVPSTCRRHPLRVTMPFAHYYGLEISSNELIKYYYT